MNRFTCLILTIIVFSLPAMAADDVDYSLVNITDDLYHFRGGRGGNHFGLVLVTGEGIVVLDTVDPDSAQWLRNELKNRFDTPVKYLIYSHSHYDHIGGSGVFKSDGAVIVAHENAEEEILEEDKEHQWISERNIALPEVTFEEEMTISIGGKTVNLVHLGPGHSNSLIAVQFLEDKTVSIVDAANIGQVAYKTLGRPVKGYITQLKKARELEFDVVVPGHANIGTRADLDIYIDYLTTLVAQVEAAIAQGMSLEETQQSIDMERFNTLKRWDEWYLLNVQGVYEQLKEGEAG